MAVILKIFKSHLLPIVSLIELKLDGRHWGVTEYFSELLKLFCSIIQDGRILKFFKSHLPNSKSD